MEDKKITIRPTSVKRCYDCRDVVTKNYYMWDILSEDGVKMSLPIHEKCHARALYGGEPVYPERTPDA